MTSSSEEETMDLWNRLLIDKLSALSEDEKLPSAEELDELRARFLIVLSSSGETMAHLEQLGYGSVVDGQEPGQGALCGLMLRGSRLTLSQFLSELAALPRES